MTPGPTADTRTILFEWIKVFLLMIIAIMVLLFRLINPFLDSFIYLSLASPFAPRLSDRGPTVNTIACPGATRKTLGVIPLYSALGPSFLNKSVVTVTNRVIAVSPSNFDAFWIRLSHQLRSAEGGSWMYVLIVSIGALENGPIAPDTKPIIIVCQLGRLPASEY